MASAVLITLITGVVAQERTGIARVAWLQGCWEYRSPQATIEEHWMAPRGGAMIGTGRTVRDNRLVEYEFVVLREQGAQLAYEAHPSGQAPAVFLSKELTDSTVEFDNPAHDFPQRIGYRREGRDALVAWIEGPDKERTRRIEFRYQRVACP